MRTHVSPQGPFMSSHKRAWAGHAGAWVGQSVHERGQVRAQACHCACTIVDPWHVVRDKPQEYEIKWVP